MIMAEEPSGPVVRRPALETMHSHADFATQTNAFYWLSTPRHFSHPFGGYLYINSGGVWSCKGR